MNRKKKLTQADLKELGVRPGFVTRHYRPDGRAVVQRLRPEKSAYRPDARRKP